MCRDPFFSLLMKRDILRNSFSIFVCLKIFKCERKTGQQVCTLCIPSYTLTVLVFLMRYKYSITLETLTGAIQMHN